jgi:hypothetical protein
MRYTSPAYLEQLDGFMCDAFANTYSKFVNTNAIHTYPHCVFYLNGPLNLKTFDGVYCLPHVLSQNLNLW